MNLQSTITHSASPSSTTPATSSITSLLIRSPGWGSVHRRPAVRRSSELLLLLPLLLKRSKSFLVLLLTNTVNLAQDGCQFRGIENMSGLSHLGRPFPLSLTFFLRSNGLILQSTEHAPLLALIVQPWVGR